MSLPPIFSIFAVAGNHDGMVVPGTGATALAAFMENFCAEGFHETAAARGLGRTAQIQPGVYFTLEAPFVRILALYSNIFEGPGVISDQDNQFPELGRVQLEYLEAALNRVKRERFEGAGGQVRPAKITPCRLLSAYAWQASAVSAHSA